MNNPTDRKYSREHEWVLVTDDTLTVGITDHAQEQLTDIVFVEFPEVAQQVHKGDSVVVLESVKSVADVYAPCTGEVVEINTELETTPALINEDPFGKGWIFKLKASDPDLSTLLDAQGYQGFLETE